jgi:acetyl esterase
MQISAASVVFPQPAGPTAGTARRRQLTQCVSVAALRDRAEQWIAARLLRAPQVVRHWPARRRPIDLDGCRLDADVQFMLELLAASGRPPTETLPLAEARRQMRALAVIAGGPHIDLPHVEDRNIAGPSGPLAVRLYRPTLHGATAPALTFFHGGGGVIGDLDSHDALCRLLAAWGQCVVVSVDYRLAPEHPFPAAVDDALAAFYWVVEHAEHLRVDPRRVAVGGDSMGGCLAAVVAHAARDGGGPRPCFQLLIYPSTDRAGETRSRLLFANGFFLTESLLAWFVEHYTGGADPADPQISPLRATDFRELAPAFVATAGFDPLRDEGQAYAERLREAGVSSEHHCHTSLVHGYVQMGSAVEAATAAMADIAAALRRGLCSAG